MESVQAQTNVNVTTATKDTLARNSAANQDALWDMDTVWDPTIASALVGGKESPVKTVSLRFTSFQCKP